MKYQFFLIAGMVASFAAGYQLTTVRAARPASTIQPTTQPLQSSNMKLGAFSLSMNVKDLKTSQAFYEKLGFTVLGGGLEQRYLVMKNEQAVIGLFQGMFEGHILTFNPGWDANGKNVDPFDDIRQIQQQLKNSGLTLTTEASDKTTGPASVMLTDPDGNMILIDQHR